MSQHSLSTDVNVALAALGSTMKGPSAPPVPLAGMLWLDDNVTPWVLKIYDGVDWIPLGLVNPTTNAFIADGLAAGRFFAPRANDPADLRVKLEAGLVFDVTSQTLTAVASQQTATLTAPATDPRKDIVYIDRLTGILGVATGTEAASPVDPAIPAGKLPVARINWTAGATAITTAMIDDVRVLNALGLGALAVLNYVTDLPQNVSLSGDITPPTITSDQNNYEPSGLATASTLRLSANGARAITGIAGGSDGRLLILHNIDTPKITLKNESAASTAGNRLTLNSDITLAVNQAALLQYDSVSERWRAVAAPCKDNSNIGQLQRSLRFNDDDNTYLNRTPGSTGNRKTWTFSAWIKLADLAAISGNASYLLSATNGASNSDRVVIVAGNQLRVSFDSDTSGSVETAARLRDPTAWYHVVASIDTNQAAASDRCKIYLNGVAQQLVTNTTIPQGYDSTINSIVAHNIGRQAVSTAYHFDGYMTEIHFVDGQQLTPASFGEFDAVTGVWMPKKYEGTYGNNGFYLDFSDNTGTTSATLGRDRSGNNNDWTPNNFSVSAGPGNDSLIDIPVNFDDGGQGKGNYATLSSIRTTGGTIANGALEFSNASTGTYYAVAATQAMQVKTYWEIYRLNGFGQPYSGIIDDGAFPTPGGSTAALIGGTANSWGLYGNYIRHNDANVTAATNAGAGQTEMWAFDPATGKLWHGVEGAWDNSGNPAAGTGQVGTADSAKSWFAAAAGVDGYVAAFNFGQRPFAYTPPEGFKALNTQNLPEPAIVKPGTQMNAVLYTGNGATQSITGVGFQPDLVWLKSRSNALDHKLTDAVRGATKGLESNTADAESTDTNGLTSFASDGFALGSDATYNTNAATYVAWAWKTGTTPGLDIVSYTGDGNAGRTVSHGLGVAPALVIVKNRTDSGGPGSDWAVWHHALANTEAFNLNTGAQKFGATTYWNSTTPSASVLTLGTNSAVNANAKSYIAYLWAEVAGFSRFGTYTGNGSADGPFVPLGFRPAFVVLKRTDGTSHWETVDKARDTYNPVGTTLDLNNANTDSVDAIIDFTASGFKLRNAAHNVSSATYIFAAFAENPFKYARAR